MKFTVEKVLYFAEGVKRLHVAHDEAPRNTDLHQIVTKELAAGNLYQCGEDDTGRYYAATNAGLIKLYQLKIQSRKALGKKVDREQRELERLKGAAA